MATKTKAVKSKAKTKATKGDASVPIAQPVNNGSSNSDKPYALKVPLPKISPQEAETVAVEMLRDAYVEAVKFYLKEKEKPEGERDDKQVEGSEDILKALEKVIIWFDQSPMWLEDLHAGRLPNQQKKSA